MTRYEEVQVQLRKQPKTWLVTGVAGFIGSNLLETLLKLDQIVVGLDNFATGFQHNLDEVQTLVTPEQWARFKFIHGDIRQLEACQQACNPVNMMGASKRIMELFLMRESLTQPISMARFANVAFSDGSLLHGFNQRFAKRQPISVPNDVRRYFVTPQESGELCLLSCLLGGNRDILFPKLSEKLHLITFSEIAVRYLRQLGFEPYECASEDEARDRADGLIAKKQWPCYFFKSDTTGEKDFEEFFTDKEDLDMSRFESVGVIRNPAVFDGAMLDRFSAGMAALRNGPTWTKAQIVELFFEMLPDFAHMETGKYLDQRM